LSRGIFWTVRDLGRETEGYRRTQRPIGPIERRKELHLLPQYRPTQNISLPVTYVLTHTFCANSKKWTFKKEDNVVKLEEEV
jgi:hypothetical protein